ncbi:MAG TPA: cyanophycinase [Bacteroidales bacterium]|nr:cyanophycinase [Bacteroidales bacterium]HPS16778.1 cyanophycinase [Bacteroidales bacterium]
MSKGYLLLIGGGEDTAIIYNRMFELAGGKQNSRIAIIPSASSHVGSTMKNYEEYFVELGIEKKNIWSVPLAVADDIDTILVNEETWKDNAYHKEIAEKIIDYNIVFFVGGDQRKYIDALKKNKIESPLLLAIEGIYQNGGIIAGTSAGTNILSKNSIAGGRSEDALLNRVVNKDEDDDGNKLLIINGLGLVDNIIFDTHFETRGRLGRLSDAVVLTNSKYGIGISERTAVILGPDMTIEIIGYGNILIVDLNNAKLKSQPRKQLHVREISVTLLTHGDKFNLVNQQIFPNTAKKSIINIPYFDANDYHISLNVFKEYETSQILINYMLDNEAKDVIALMDYDTNFNHGDISSFIRFVEKDNTQAWFGKLSLENEDEFQNFYSGANVLLDIIPLKYIKDGQKQKNFNVVLFGIDSNLQLVVYDNLESLPVVDAKVFVYNSKDELIFKKGSDRYGRSLIRNIFKAGEEYTIKIKYDNEEKNYPFIFEPDMPGICLS